MYIQPIYMYVCASTNMDNMYMYVNVKYIQRTMQNRSKEKYFSPLFMCQKGSINEKAEGLKPHDTVHLKRLSKNAK